MSFVFISRMKDDWEWDKEQGTSLRKITVSGKILGNCNNQANLDLEKGFDFSLGFLQVRLEIISQRGGGGRRLGGGCFHLEISGIPKINIWESTNGPLTLLLLLLLFEFGFSAKESWLKSIAHILKRKCVELHFSIYQKDNKDSRHWTSLFTARVSSTP